MALTRNPLDMLFIGGSGIISHASVERAVRLGHHVTVLNRGQSTTHPLPEDVEFLVADVHDGAAVDEVLRGRGFDVVALIAAPTILGATPAWSLGMAVAVFLFLRAGFNVGEMQAEAEETRRELEAEKAKASGEKIKVSRPAR